VRIVAAVAVAWLAVPLTMAAYKEGPLPNRTGGFGDMTCQQCHLDNPLNDAGGSLTVSGVPATYTPGQSYPVTVTLSRAEMQRGGFEIAARFATGTLEGQQAGRWRTLDERVQIIASRSDPTLLFAQHNVSGSVSPARGTNSWIVEWIAPDRPAAEVQFNAAGNATNDDASALGDFVYLNMLRSTPGK
jgi:hypothetical protein